MNLTPRSGDTNTPASIEDTRSQAQYTDSKENASVSGNLHLTAEASRRVKSMTAVHVQWSRSTANALGPVNGRSETYKGSLSLQQWTRDNKGTKFAAYGDATC